MPALLNRNLTQHRGSPRIYLDDAILDLLGVDEAHPFYDRIWQDDKLILRISENGKYKVSSKAKGGRIVNVIDINTSKLTELFDDNSKLRIAIQKGSIVIKAHSSELAIRKREASYLDAIQSSGTLTIASSFHGGGLMDYAVHEGFKKADIPSVVKFAIEIDSRYLNSSMLNNSHIFDSNTVFINSDVADVHAHNLPHTNILVAGIPCVGASPSGISKNKIKFAEEHESAGACFFNLLNIIKGSNPAVIILENVKQYIATASFAVIQSVLGSLGYDLTTTVYNGLDFGATEARERMVCIAVSKGLNAFGLLQNIKEMIEANKTPSTPLSEVLDDLPLDHPSWKEVLYLKQKQVRDKAMGKGFAMQILTKDAVSCGVIGSGYASSLYRT